MAGKPIATIGSMHICPMCSGTVPHVGGPISGSGAPNVLINGKPVALMGDMCVCVGPPDVIAQGSPLVKVNGVPVVCVGDLTAHGGTVTVGEPTVTISAAVPTPSQIMPREKIPFPKISITNRKLGNAEEAIANQKKLAALAEETPVPEDSTEVTLETTFPQDQLHLLASNDRLEDFLHQMITIFGQDIPGKAYEELFHDAKNKGDILTPTLVVKKTIPYGGKALFYNNKEVQEIWVGEQIIRDAVADNDYCGELLVILVEEYGHYIDYLLRNHYAETVRKDALRDEGAYFSYQMLQFNSIDETNQYYADATIEGAAHQLRWDYEPFHKAIKEFVNEERWNADNQFGPFEFYKAGFLKEKDGQYSHGNIERTGLTKSYLKSELGNVVLIEDEEIPNYLLNIYFGNWNRDYSQGLDPLILRVLSNSVAAIVHETNNLTEEQSLSDVFERVNMDRIKTYTPSYDDKVTLDLNKLGVPLVDLGTITFSPVEKSVKLIATILEMLAVKEFVHRPIEEAEKENDFDFLRAQVEKAEQNANGVYTFPKELLEVASDKKSVLNYNQYLHLLKYNFTPVDRKNLGVYIPAEHIDNPKGIGEANAENDDAKLLPEFMGNDLGVNDTDDIHCLNMDFGMKNYIRNAQSHIIPEEAGKTRFKNSHTYILYKLKEACSIPSGYNSPAAKDSLGAALHTLEDFFAHSNYAEIALIKEGAYGVFPWVTKVEGKIDYLKFIKNRDERSKVLNNSAYDVVTNTVGIHDANRLTTKIPLVTGTFGMLDTVASILPIIAHAFDADAHKLKSDTKKTEEKEQKKEDGHFYYKEKINMRTFNDVLILELLRDLTNDDSEKESKLTVEDSALVNKYLALLSARDLAYTNFDKASENYRNLKEPFKSWVDWIIDSAQAPGEAIGEFISHQIEKIKMPIYRILYSFLQFSATNLNDVQVLQALEIEKLENQDKESLHLDIGINPTHTQVAKDDPHHPMHTLSAQLAIEAVSQVGTAVFNLWRGEGSFEKEVVDAVDAIMRHPAQTTWQTSTVTEWIDGTSIIKEDSGCLHEVSNKKLICDASTPTIAIQRLVHTNEEIKDNLEKLKKISNSEYFKLFNRVTNKIVKNLKEDNPEEFDRIKDTYRDATKPHDKTIAKIKEEFKQGKITYFDRNIKTVEATLKNQEARLLKIEKLWAEQFPKPLYCRCDSIIMYTVSRGDTLNEIAKRRGITEDDILALNPMILDSDIIRSGDVIKLPYSNLDEGIKININNTLYPKL